MAQLQNTATPYKPSTFARWMRLAMQKGQLTRAGLEAEKNRRTRLGLWRVEKNAWWASRSEVV